MKVWRIKYHMQKGAGMVYSWSANRTVLYELHGEPDVKPAGAGDDYYESYEKDDAGKKESHGTFTAPSTESRAGSGTTSPAAQ